MPVVFACKGRPTTMSSLPGYRDIMDLLKKGMTIEAQEKIMELRSGALELQEENLRLRERIRTLELEASRARALIFEKEIYWMQLDDGRKDGPFCPRCYDDSKKLVRLHDGRKRVAQCRWICLSCKYTSDYHDELP